MGEGVAGCSLEGDKIPESPATDSTLQMGAAEFFEKLLRHTKTQGVTATRTDSITAIRRIVVNTLRSFYVLK